MRSLACFFASFIVAAAPFSVARADKPARTWNHLPTGNGHGFAVYDTARNKITHFLEHPYRFLRPSAGDPRADGVGRRNLAYDFYFGVRGGGGSAWLNEATAGEPEYVEQTNVIHVPISAAGISADAYYFSPFGYEGNALIAVLKAPGASDAFALFNFHMGGGSRDMPDANGESLRMGSGQVVVETGPGGGAMVYVPLSPITHADCSGVFNKVKAGQNLGDNSTCSGNDIVPAFQGGLEEGHFAVAVLFVDDAAQADAAAMNIRTFVAGRKPAALLDGVLKDFQSWRKPPPDTLALCSDDEKRLYRQSEAVLRMGQVREPNTASRRNNGMVLASLPIGEWHSGWVRDALYGVVALARMGHFEEARMGLDFFLNAAPVGKYKSYVSNQDYRISVVRYYGNGEEEADYSGQRTPNIEIDGWGMFLWAARIYVDASGDVAWLGKTTLHGDSVWSALTQGVAKPLIGNLEPSGIAKADSSIWEVHDENKKHFAYTTLATIRGFCDLAAIAKQSGHDSDVKTYADLSQKAKAGFFSAFVDQNGALAGSTEELGMNQYLDGAVVEAFTWNVIADSEYDGRTAKATLDLIEKLRVESGGFKRNDDGLSSYDNNEWILIDLRMSDAQWRTGREQEAKNMFQIVLDKASANFNLLPELYNAVRADGAVGKYAGSIPMVGYGSGAYVLTVFDRSGLVEPNHCGDGAGNKSSGRVYKCASDGMMMNNNNGTPTAEELPYENACLCSLGRASKKDSGHGLFWFALVLLVGSVAWRGARRRA